MQAPFATSLLRKIKRIVRVNHGYLGWLKRKANRAQRRALERFTRRVAAGHDFDGESFTVPPTLTGRDL